MRNEFLNHLNGDRVYLVDNSQIEAGGWHFQIGPTSHVVLNDLNFLEHTGSDPYRQNRMDVVAHEASHALGYLDDPEEGPSAYEIGQFCSKDEDQSDPWMSVGPPLGGGGPWEDPSCPSDPEAIVCECWILVAWHTWIEGVWTQISDPWWEPDDCED